MLQNAYFLAKIGADTAENEQHLAEILPIGRRVADRPTRPAAAARQAEEYPLAPIPRKRQRTYVPPTPSAAQLHHVHAAHHLRRGVALSAQLLTRR